METILTLDDLRIRLQIKPAPLKRMFDRGELPEHLEFSDGKPRWRETVVAEWIVAGCPPQRTEAAR